jgi:hypothetical protein
MTMIRSLFLSIVLLAAVATASGQDYSRYNGCAEQDSLALVAFYNATGGANWFSSQSDFSVSKLSDNALYYHTTEYPNSGMGKWLQGPVKDWFGVLLEKQAVGVSGDSIFRVVHVNPTLSRRSAGDNHLIGYIPREIGFLTALQWFKVNGNAGLTKSELPDELWHPSLEILDLEAAYLEGQMSSAMRKCTKLRAINFRYNLFDSVPIFDFLSPENILKYFCGETFFYYNNRIPYSNIEPSINYFLTFSNPKQVLYEARQQHDIGQEREVIVTAGQKVVLSMNVGGTNGTYTWYKGNFSKYVTGSTYTINSMAAKDTGAYKVLVANEFVRLGDYNADYSNVFSNPIYVRFTPSAPYVKGMKTNYAGTEVELTFTKPMAQPSNGQSANFTISAQGRSVAVTSIRRGGRFSEKLILGLATPILMSDSVTLSYAAGSIVCANNGALGAFVPKPVTNLTRGVPSPISAETRADGSGVFITFDRYIDPATLNAADFTVSNGATILPSQVVLKSGIIDEGISKTIELILPENLKSTDVVTVSFKRGILAALYGSISPAFDMSVSNKVLDSRASVLIQVEDGTKNLSSIAVKGTMKNLPFVLYDNGTNGDKISGDHVWSAELFLNDGQYTWNVYKRTVVTRYDTIRTVHENGSITLTITPTFSNNDELISPSNTLAFNVLNKQVTGSTYFGYRNNAITFVLDMTGFKVKYPNVTVAPYLMGLNNDWSVGLEMKAYGSGTAQWSVTSTGYSIGDKVSFNFRNGYYWENTSPVSRNHTVIGNDTIYLSYGVFTSSKMIQMDGRSLVVAPNPAIDQLFARVPESFVVARATITDIMGRTRYDRITNGTSIPVADLSKGMYILVLWDVEGNTIQCNFIKK